MSNIYIKCHACGGRGYRTIGQEENGTPIYENPCSVCSGSNYNEFLYTDDTKIDNLTDKVNDTLDKVNDIKEKVDEIKKMLHRSNKCSIQHGKQ